MCATEPGKGSEGTVADSVVFQPRNSLVRAPRGGTSVTSVATLVRTRDSGHLLRTGTIHYSISRGLCIRLPYNRNVVPRSRKTVNVTRKIAGSVILVAHIGGPIYFAIAKFHRASTNPRPILSQHVTRRVYGRHFLSCLRYNSVVPTHVAHLRAFKTFYSMNYNLSTLLPVTSVSVDHVDRPASHFAMNVRVATIMSSLRGGHVYLSRQRLLNA